MKTLHVLLMLAGVFALGYSLAPRHWRREDPQTLDSAQIAQILSHKERKS